MSFDLNSCRPECIECIKQYAKKHNLGKGEEFSIPCNGIPKKYISPDVLKQLDEDARKTAISLLDPVEWAKQTLDWHCFDDDGSIWKRKNPEDYASMMARNPDQVSTYHRPQQALMLRCTAPNKVLRIGRQFGKTQALVILALFLAVTIDKYRIVIIAPQLSQVQLIFDIFASHIDGCADLSNSVKRSVKAPNYSIKFYSGSTIVGFTAGTKSASNAGSVRGQGADLLIFDEADYLAPADIESAMALITNSPNARVWMSSTPTGKRQKFYNTCFNRFYKEFHYAASINPMWSKEKEREYRFQLGDIAYEHEAEAEFGEQEQGVFQYVHVTNAQVDYQYSTCIKHKHWFYMVGVDWNDTKNGTTIAVTGFNPADSSFTRVASYNVKREGWTQTMAMQKIVEVNRAWRPVSIYVDQGYGSTQIEMLRLFGLQAAKNPQKGRNHPDAKLKDIIKPYDFGGKVQIKDPLTDLLIKKDAKPFLVETTTRRLERGDFCFSKHDKALIDQLLAYVVERTTQSGRPVYKTNNDEIGDHELDAMMLSLVGFSLESSVFSTTDHTIYSVVKTGNFGDALPKEEKNNPMVPDRSPANQKTNKRKQTNTQEQEKESRVEVFNAPQTFQHKTLPAHHMNRSQSRNKVWSWPGFMRDEPPPRRNKGSSTGWSRSMGRPRRNNI